MSSRDQGYSIFDGVFERKEISGLLETLAASDLERTKAGARHLLKVPVVRDLALDPRMVAIARQFVGPTAVAYRATLFDKSPDANWLVVWHQDTALPLRNRIENPEWGPWSTKAGLIYAHAPASALEQVVALRVSLDDSTSTNGPLRVLPNTHRDGVFCDDRIAQAVRETAAVDCLAASGGVIAMRPLTIHASSKSIDRQRRRVLHIEYAATLQVASGTELAMA